MDDSTHRARLAPSPVISFAEKDDVRDMLADTCGSPCSSPGRSGAASPAFAAKRAERAAMARAAPGDRLESSARRGIMSSIFAAKAPERDAPRRGLVPVEHVAESAEGKLTSAFLFDSVRPSDFVA